MSSILRALKKLDEESMSQEGEEHAGEQKKKMRRMVYRRARTPRLFNRFIFVLSAFLLLGAAFLIFMNLKGKPSITEEQDTAAKMSADALEKQPPGLKKELKKEPAKESTPQSMAVEQSNSSTIPAAPVITGETIAQKTIDQKERESVKQNKHPDFILNGVLWSDTPARRVALINDRYLKEGDEIDGGVSIIRIEKKSVTLKSGEETWTIRLKR